MGGSRILVWEGHWQKVWGTEVPQWGPKAQPQWGSRGRAPTKPKECYVMRLKNWVEKNRLILYDDYHNYHHLIRSSFFRSHFCLKVQNAVCELQRQRNGPQWQPVLELVLGGLAKGRMPPADPRPSSFGQCRQRFVVALGGEN